MVTEVVAFDQPMAFLETREVSLPYDASPYYVGDDEEILRFEVQAEVADATDEEPSNGWMSATFRRPPTWQYTNLDDNRMIVWTKTNNVPGETTVEIRHANGNLYWARSYSEANTTYRDTIVLNQGCYRFTVNDSGDDGIDFWANNDGSGYVRLKRVSGGNFHIFESDFGKSISQAFYFATNLYSNVEELDAAGDLAVFPNPVNETLTLLPAGWGGNAEWEVYSVHGQLLDRGTWWSQSGMRSSLDASAWPSGTLVVVVRHNGSKWARWVVKE